MPAYGVQVVKGFTWRGAQEETSNLYHYDVPGGPLTESGWESLVDQLVAIEKTIFGFSVNFLRARVFGPTYEAHLETPALKEASQMRYVKDLTGTGTVGGASDIPHEFAVLGSFYVGRGPKGGKRFLRKYWHVLTLKGSTESSLALRGAGPITQTSIDAYKLAMNDMKSITVGANSNDLCTPGGTHLPLLSDPVINPYLRVRQLRQ